MTNNQFINKAKEISLLNTAYASGTFGQKFTESFIKQKAKQYPKAYPESKINDLRAKAKGKTLYLFDCCGLIKGIIWGFPNMVYTSNGMKDVNDQGIWDQYCINKSKDFTQIKAGAILHIKGHVGIYIGDGKAIECTSKWSDNVLISAVSNIGKISGLNSRKWTEFGYLSILDKKPVPIISKLDYVVKRGDCLSRIARQHSTTVYALLKLNPEIKDPNKIYVGQIIHIKV